jgi:hypothetical protein
VIVVDQQEQELEIYNHHWPLAEDLFVKWGMTPDNDNVIKVSNIHDIAPELSAWGIPWRITK